MSRVRFVLLAAFGLAVAVALGMMPAATARTTLLLDPARDVALPERAYAPACNDHPLGTVCENVFVRALNRGRAAVGAPDYRLPEHFRGLSGADQLIVLANLDRKLYGRAPIVGRNATLTASAQRGAVAASEPAFVPVGGSTLTHGGSNWAGGTRSPLFAYFLWMYHDAGLNWLHRHNVLMPVGGDVLIMGVGSALNGNGSHSWTALLESFRPGTLIECVPTVLLLSARSGTDPGTSSIRILGLGFVHVRRVTFGGVPASFERLSSGLLRVVPPAHAPGAVQVQVVTAGGTSLLTAASVYTY